MLARCSPATVDLPLDAGAVRGDVLSRARDARLALRDRVLRITSKHFMLEIEVELELELAR